MPRAHLVNVRAFRANMTHYLRQAQEEGKSIVIMRHTQPLARIVPFDDGTVLEDLVKETVQKIKAKAKKRVAKTPQKKGGFRRLFGL